jgi:hypothetical protein
MSTLVYEGRAVQVWFDDDNIWLGLEDGRQVSAPLAFYPRLLNATKEQRENYEFIGPGIGIHWEDLDEDLSVEGMFWAEKIERPDERIRYAWRLVNASVGRADASVRFSKALSRYQIRSRKSFRGQRPILSC